MKIILGLFYIWKILILNLMIVFILTKQSNDISSQIRLLNKPGKVAKKVRFSKDMKIVCKHFDMVPRNCLGIREYDEYVYLSQYWICTECQEIYVNSSTFVV